MKERTIKIAVFLSDDEAADLDRRRDAMPRAAYLRAAALDCLPPVIPELNREAWAVLARAAGNLATVANAMRGGEYVEADRLRVLVDEFRRGLLGASPELDNGQ